MSQQGGTKRGKVAVIAHANSMADMPIALRHIGVANLAALGYDVVFGKHIDEQHFYFAGSLEQRLDDFHWAVTDRDIDIIMPVFGGYNSNQLLPYLDYRAIAAANKVIVGFSDTTALLIAIDKFAGTPAIHGPSFSVFCDPSLFADTTTCFVDAIRNERLYLTSPAFVADDHWYRKEGFGPREKHPFDGWKVYRHGEVRGKLVGGNLETLASLAGTPFFPNTDGCLLFVEDTTGATPGAFHRHLTQFRQMGVLEQIVGLLVGLMPRGSQLANAGLMTYILDDVLQGLAYPVLYEVNCSHTDPMLSLRLGAEALLVTAPYPHLTVLAGTANTLAN